MSIDNYGPASGRKLRNDDTVINEADYLAPTPNGDQIITAAANSVQTLTPPNTGNIRADLVCPVDCWVRFGAVPAVGAGELFPAGAKIKFMSDDEIAAAQIYVTAAATLFVQYYK